MFNAQLLLSRLASATLTVVFAVAFAPAVHAQNLPSVHVGDRQITGLPDDWSHHRVVFSDPGTEKDAVRSGRYEQWLKTVNDPRYVINRMRRGLSVQGPASQDVETRYRIARSFHGSRDPWNHHGQSGSTPSKSKTTIQRDWSMNLGNGAGLTPGQYPAKYSFDVSTADCSDYIVFPTELMGSSSQATVVAYNNLYKTTCGSSTAPQKIYWAYNTGGITGLSPVLAYDGTQVAYVQNGGTGSSVTTLSQAVNSTTTTTVDVNSYSNIAVGDYVQVDSEIMVVTGTGNTPVRHITVTRGQLGTTATTHSSGANVYIVSASLVLLKMASSNGTAGAPAALTSVTPANYQNCTAPCYTAVAFANGNLDTNSAPFYDYPNDVLYVGDDSGVLHKFTGIFFATPGETTGGGRNSGWPQTMTSGNVLTSPVLDSSSNNIFVADSGGYLYRVPTTGGSNNVAQSGHIASNGSTGIVDSPIVDSAPATPLVYVFVSDSGGSSRVYRFTNSFADGTSGNYVTLGTANTATNLYDGDFDNTHYTGTGTTGNLYVCGYYSNRGTEEPRLYQIALNSTFAGTASTVLSPTNGAATCSPVTESYNASHDWIYLSVTAYGNDTGCTGSSTNGCIYSYDVTGSTPTAASAGLAAAGGTSGIVIDNDATGTGESQIYYTTLSNQTCAGNGSTGNGTGGCAVQASQVGLN